MRSRISIPLPATVFIAAVTGIYALVNASFFGAASTCIALGVMVLLAYIWILICLGEKRKPGDALVDRLLEAMGYEEDGRADNARSKASVALALACQVNGGSPSSMNDLLEVLKWDVFLHAFGVKALSPLEPKDVNALRLRCKAVTPHVAERFLGVGWSWSPDRISTGSDTDHASTVSHPGGAVKAVARPSAGEGAMKADAARR